MFRFIIIKYKMKKILLFTIFFTIFSVFGQSNPCYSVLYKVVNVDFKENPEKKSELLSEIKQNAESQEFQLNFNKFSCHFFELERLNSDDSTTKRTITKLAKIRFTCDFNYFYDKQNGLEYFQKQNGVLLRDTLIEKKWEITSESKMIDKYTCYKAIYNYNYVGRDKKIKTRYITAWFAPELPYSFGPKNYNGLPGLILELTDLYTTFLATKIELKQNLLIDMPVGKTLTTKEYEQKTLMNN